MKKVDKHCWGNIILLPKQINKGIRCFIILSSLSVPLGYHQESSQSGSDQHAHSQGAGGFGPGNLWHLSGHWRTGLRLHRNPDCHRGKLIRGNYINRHLKNCTYIEGRMVMSVFRLFSFLNHIWKFKKDLMGNMLPTKPLELKKRKK